MEPESDAPLLALIRRGGRTEWRFGGLPHAISGSRVGRWPILMRNDADVGRHVVAARDLATGDLLYSEDPFVQTVEDALLTAVCHQCYAPIISADGTAQRSHGCDVCGQVIYCCTACQRAGARAHAAECGVLHTLAARGVSLKALRGLRLFIRLAHRAHDEPDAFKDVEALHEHYTIGTPERRTFFDGVASQINKLVPPPVRLEPVRLAKLVSRVHTNLFAVSDCAGIQYGSALYAKAGTILNHSCQPSAAVSFKGASLRVHAVRPIRAGEEVAISYTELYAGRDERRSSMQTKKGFMCACARCEQPPAADAELDGWRCLAGCERGIVPPGGGQCLACGASHALDAARRAGIEERWRQATHEGLQGLQGHLGQPSPAAAEGALRTAEQILSQTAGRLCEDHVARHRARRMRVLALQSFSESRAAELAAALEGCLDGMRRHLPRAHPEVAFYEHWLAKTRLRQAARHDADGASDAAHEARRSARELASAAAAGLAVSYGNDHPTVAKWRALAASAAASS